MRRGFWDAVSSLIRDRAPWRAVSSPESQTCFHICRELFPPKSLLSHLIHINKSVHGDDFDTDVLVKLSLSLEINKLWHSSYLQLRGLEFLKEEPWQQRGLQMGDRSPPQTPLKERGRLCERQDSRSLERDPCGSLIKRLPSMPPPRDGLEAPQRKLAIYCT